MRVVNTGPVVPPELVERLFLPFTRLDDRTRHDGFGLGLALVSSIAAVHDGTVHHRRASGLDVIVRLPAATNPHPCRPPLEHLRPATYAAQAGRGIPTVRPRHI